MNMTVLRHEYKRGCTLTFIWGRGNSERFILTIYLHPPCLNLIWGQGIVQRQQCYDLACEDGKVL